MDKANKVIAAGDKAAQKGAKILATARDKIASLEDALKKARSDVAEAAAKAKSDVKQAREETARQLRDQKVSMENAGREAMDLLKSENDSKLQSMREELKSLAEIAEKTNQQKVDILLAKIASVETELKAAQDEFEVQRGRHAGDIEKDEGGI